MNNGKGGQNYDDSDEKDPPAPVEDLSDPRVKTLFDNKDLLSEDEYQWCK